MRTCDDDGRIRHVDRPLALIDDCLFGEPARGERLAWATTTSTRGRQGVDLRRRHQHLRRAPGHRRRAGARRHRARRAARSTTGAAGAVATVGSIGAELAPRDWALWVCAPPGERADAGDLAKYVTVPSDLD